MDKLLANIALYTKKGSVETSFVNMVGCDLHAFA